jgi:lysozyme
MDINRIVEQLKQDEDFKSKPYWDKKQWTYGYGCKAPGPKASIAEDMAAELLAKRTTQAISEFQHLFEYHVHKLNEVRQEAFVNMVFNMGPGSPKNPGAGGLSSFVNTLRLIFSVDEPEWKRVADNLRQSKWYRQVGSRAVRICKEIETGERAA